MRTRIFSVSYDISELYDGKDRHTFSETRNVVANDAEDAIQKIKTQNLKATTFINNENKKKVKVKITRSGFAATNVNLMASTD